MSEKNEEVSRGVGFGGREEEVFAFWNKAGIFEKSVRKPAPRGAFVFYDGPPFATGLPHFGHILASTIKDAIPRFRTMQGYRVNRRWGWDCHGLPLENQIEEQLGIKTKKEIEERGVAVFNEAARGAVLTYAEDWKRFIPRIGRWVDMENDYKTMDTSYTESVWWAFANLYNRGLIYEGYKTMQLCPRCGTTLSNFEVAQGYKDIEDIAVTVKMPLVGDEKTSILIWTTTPWTLPGNTAVAIHKDATYVRVQVGDEQFIVGKELVEKLFDTPKIVSEFLGKELVGKKYIPPFPYFVNRDIKGKNKAWRVYHAPYVSLEDGTGAVHLAPAFGEEDKQLADKEGVPLIHHVGFDGLMTAETEVFAGLPAKPKGNHKVTDLKIIEALEASRRLFKQEGMVHSYPHCWRCDTPLLNYAASSWFVNVQKLKKKLLSENKKIHWVPGHIGEGRFMNLLATAPDWAISRSRYWGAPLPVWRNKKTGEMKVVSSIEELLKHAKRSGNRYFVMRHGEARSNVEGFVNATNSIENHLTDAGKEAVKKQASALARENIDLIVASPLLRTQETARILRSELGLPDSALMTDERLREVSFGSAEGKAISEWERPYPELAHKFTDRPHDGETYAEVRERMGAFIFEIERRYTGKNILIVTHGTPSWLLFQVASRTSLQKCMQASSDSELHPGEAREMAFVPYPHNPTFEVDLHRPYIDEITWGNPIDGVWERVVDVFDCWFESGSMPFASEHYPQNKKNFDPKRGFGFLKKGYPADFIAEGVDQTRGWFYSLIVLGTALFGRSPYKAVVTTGLVLAEDGKKMSKKLKNYPDPMELVNRYGADALRYYLLSSPIVRGEDLNFSERGVDEVAKKVIARLENVRTFYELYAKGVPAEGVASEHVLDLFIRARLSETIEKVTAALETYELDLATRPLGDFIDDLSTWYVRRSRDRFKGEGEDAKAARATLRFVLLALARTMAPITPFYAEHLYRSLRTEADPESVHLASWPEAGSYDEGVLEYMKSVRSLVTLGLEARAKAGIKVRQPLAALYIPKMLPDAYAELLLDEVNVKKVLPSDTEEVALDVTITPELRAEGMRRDVARLIQEFRKAQKFRVEDRPALVVTTTSSGKTFVEGVKDALMKETGLSDLTVVLDTGDTPPEKDLGFPVLLSVQS